MSVFARAAIRLSLSACVFHLVGGSAAAGFAITFEAPGVQASTVSNTVVETFDTLLPATGVTTISSAFGTYTSPGLAVVGADQFGGAFQTTYVSVGAQSAPVTEMTLTLTGPAFYFGFYSAAMDAQNRVEFYLGGTLLNTVDLSVVTTSGLLATTGGPFGTGHYGNPNVGGNTSEPYVFVNFFATDGTTFDQIVIRNAGTGTGYETDNHTVRFTPVPPPFPGTPLNPVAAPAPPTALAALAVLPLAGWVRRRRAA